MKILVIIPTDELGGAEQYLKMLIEYYLEKKAFVSVIFMKKQKSSGWDDLQVHENLNIHYCDSNSLLGGVGKLIIKILGFRKTKFDFVFTSHVLTNGIMGLLARFRFLKKRNLVSRESTSIFTRFSGIKLTGYKLLYYLGYPAIDLLICQTQFMKEQLVKAKPNLAQKIKVIPNPINHKLIKEQETKILDASEKEHLGDYIVSAGRLIKEKGFDILIHAHHSIIKSLELKDLKLIILGEGSERGRLEKLITDYNLGGKVVLRGFVENVYPYFKNAKACVVSSRIEGFPNVLLQMMSQNINVISTKCAGGIDKIEGIYLSEINNINSLELAIIEAIDQNKSNNRDVFDTFLEKRSVDATVTRIERELEK